MALLRKCLMQLRVRRGDPNLFVWEYPALTRARETPAFFDALPAISYAADENPLDTQAHIRNINNGQKTLNVGPEASTLDFVDT